MLTRGCWLPVVVLLVLSGCGEDVTRVDSRFATPERTVRTLLTTYGLEEMPQEEIREQIATRGAFVLRDRATFELCFTDMNQPAGEGMAGYVLGLVAAGRDDMRYETAGERAHAFPREDVDIVMQRGEDGAYRIVLSETVPEEVRQTMLQIEENAERQRNQQ